jgi:hypothetical protein
LLLNDNRWMTKLLRPLAVAAVFVVSAGAGTAGAQTLIVRRAPIGATIELLVNATPAGSAQADAAGDAKVPFDLQALTKKTEIDARVYVDSCDNLRRVAIVERDAAPVPPESSCTRQELTGVFLVRRVSSLVVNVGDPVATLLLRQGPYDLRPRGPRRTAPRGFVVFGGGSLISYANALEFGCAGVPTCSGDERGFGYTVGAEYWISRYLSAEGSYIRPPALEVTGSGTAYRFDSFLEPHLFALAGKVGVPVGPVRFYGRAGFNYHRAESGTTQVTEAVTATVDGVTTTTPGSTETVTANTEGWGWLVGGGIEAWLAPAFAIYAEGGGVGIKGKPEVEEQGQIDNRITVFTAGIRVKIGR